MKRYRIKFKGYNPYEEGSTAWHCYIDCCCSAIDDIVEVKTMIKEHAMTESYYDNFLGQLVEDNILELIE